MSDGIEMLRYDRAGCSIGRSKGVKKMSGEQLHDTFGVFIKELGLYFKPFMEVMGLKRWQWTNRVRRNMQMSDDEIRILLDFSLSVAQMCCAFTFEEGKHVQGIEFLRDRLAFKAKTILDCLGKNENCGSYIGCDLVDRGYLYPHEVTAITSRVHEVGNMLRMSAMKILSK